MSEEGPALRAWHILAALCILGGVVAWLIVTSY
jgi:hypothetical protein